MYGGGYYKLEHVQQSADNLTYFMDIYLLTESCTDTAVQKKIKAHDKEVRDLADPKKAAAGLKSNLLYDDIKEHVTGYARIIHYKQVSGDHKGSSYELESVVEGQFKNGEMHGYCRAISAINGCCSAGFHKAGKPDGKWCYYRYDGTFGQPEGIYEGTKCTQPLKIKTFEQAIGGIENKKSWHKSNWAGSNNIDNYVDDYAF